MSIESVVVLRPLLDVLVQQGSPVRYQQSVRIVVRPWHPFQLSRCDQLSHQDGSAPFDALPPVIGELHLSLVKLDAVTEDAEHGTRSHDVVVEPFFLQRVVLGKSRFVHQIHGFLHRVLDVLVIGSQRKEEVVDFLYNTA